MSSNYYLLCMNHNPALVIDVDSQSIDITSGLVESMRQGALLPGNSYDHLLVHKECHLMIGRYSYPLIELGCLEGMAHGHSGIKWIDRDVLRVMLYLDDKFGVTEEVHRLLQPWRKCFGLELVRLLRNEIGEVQ